MGGRHGHTHGHGHDHDPGDVQTASLPRLLLLAGLAIAALATVIGVFVLWPSGERPTAQYAAEGVSFPHATVVSVTPPCEVVEVRAGMNSADQGIDERFEACDEVTVELDSGAEQTVHAPPGVVESGLTKGDEVELMRLPMGEGQPASYAWFGTVRDAPLGAMALLFVFVVAAVARLRGLLALVGLVFAGAVLWWFMLPALLTGGHGWAVALSGSTAIMFVVLYLAHGPSIRTSTALAGTLIGCAITAFLGGAAIHLTRLSGIGDESGEILRTHAPDLDFQGLLTCAVIIAGLGVLNDVTITQSSSIWELRSADPTMSRAALFSSGMRIGRDHIASTIYTIVFAYAGAALAVLLLISVYDRPLGALLTDEAIGAEIVRTLASGIGLVLAVPVTTAIAAITVAGPRRN